jgi:hypothetical protein
MRRTYGPICTFISPPRSPRRTQYTRNTANLTSTTAPHASARYVSSLAHSRRCASTSYTTPAPNTGSVTSAASPNAVPASACTSVFGGRAPNATPRATDERGVGLGGPLPREVVVHVDERESREGCELLQRAGENEGEDDEEVIGYDEKHVTT